MKTSLSAYLFLALTTCGGGGPGESIDGPTDGATPIAIVNVTIVPMDRERTIESQDLVLQDGRIAEIGPTGSITLPAGAFIIDGKGKYVLPGLIDMHVHIRSKELEKYLESGITSVRNMWGYDELVPLMREIENGSRRGPRVFSLSAGFDGSPAVWPQTQLVDDAALVPALIDRQYSLGFREVKVYQKLSPAAYDSVVAKARRMGMTIAGHMPPAVGLSHVLASGQRSIEHLGGYTVGDRLDEQVAATLAAGVYNCPTLAIQAMSSPSAVTANRRAVVTALHQAGARLLVGTDAGIDRTQPGSSINDELELFVDAGLTPFEALAGATRTAAEYLGQSASIGTIAKGMEADLILLRSNPMRHISATREVDVVIHDGKVFR